MQKSLLALAVLGAFAGAAQAQSSVTIYGIVDTGVVYQSKVSTGTGTTGTLFVDFGDGIEDFKTYPVGYAVL